MENSFLSIYVLAPFLAWLLGQSAKVLVSAFKAKNRGDFSLLVKSGGMPSAHAAIVISLITVIGVRDGIDTAAFGIAFAFGAIVIYDAINVRRAVGEQGEALKEIAKNTGYRKKFYTARGHLPTEVTAGSVLGLVIALVLLQIL